MKTKKKSNYELLLENQRKLKIEIKIRVDNFNDKLDYLEKNFGSMLLNSILPFNAEERSKAYGIFDKVNDFLFKMVPGKNEDVKKERYDNVFKSVQMVVAGIVFKYFKKLF